MKIYNTYYRSNLPILSQYLRFFFFYTEPYSVHLQHQTVDLERWSEYDLENLLKLSNMQDFIREQEVSDEHHATGGNLSDLGLRSSDLEIVGGQELMVVNIHVKFGASKVKVKILYLVMVKPGKSKLI